MAASSKSRTTVDVAISSGMEIPRHIAIRVDRAALDAYWRLVEEISRSERREIAMGRAEIKAILLAAGNMEPIDLAIDVEQRMNSLAAARERRRFY